VAEGKNFELPQLLTGGESCLAFVFGSMSTCHKPRFREMSRNTWLRECIQGVVDPR
jgi:hypothetical protein